MCGHVYGDAPAALWRGTVKGEVEKERVGMQTAYARDVKGSACGRTKRARRGGIWSRGRRDLMGYRALLEAVELVEMPSQATI